MKECEIRPKNIFDEYLRLAGKDAKIFFEEVKLEEIPCPACGTQGHQAFQKNGFNYMECHKCDTLFVNPRPERSAFDKYYTDSPSTRFWATTFYKETENARRAKIWKPKAKIIAEKIKKFSEAKEIIDIGGGYGTFAEEIKKITDLQILVVEPSIYLAKVCQKKGFEVINEFLEDIQKERLSKHNKCFVSFELFEHLHDPGLFLKCLNSFMGNNDCFIFTTLSNRGVDIQLLWEKSNSITPPQHINFFNPYSIRLLLSKAGFETLEITTPGKLDLDIVENNLRFVNDRFWTNFFKFVSEKDKSEMQSLLASLKLSSHMMVVCKIMNRPLNNVDAD